MCGGREKAQGEKAEREASCTGRPESETRRKAANLNSDRTRPGVDRDEACAGGRSRRRKQKEKEGA